MGRCPKCKITLNQHMYPEIRCTDSEQLSLDAIFSNVYLPSGEELYQNLRKNSGCDLCSASIDSVMIDRL